MPYADDPSIDNADYLLRRVLVNPMHVVYDDNQKRRRPSSAAFENDSNGSPMSISIEKNLLADGFTHESVLKNQPQHLTFALAKITAGAARNESQTVCKNPIDGVPAHGLVYGVKSKKVSGRLAKSSVWAIDPPDC